MNEVRKLVKIIISEMYENSTEKHFSVTDKSGRSMKPYKLTKSQIEKNWDLDEEDWDTEQTLRDFLDSCYIGDTWNTRTEKIECVSIKQTPKTSLAVS